jgi:hypothetical protein
LKVEAGAKVLSGRRVKPLFVCLALSVILVACTSAPPTILPTHTVAMIAPTLTPVLRATPVPSLEPSTATAPIEKPTAASTTTVEKAGNADVLYVRAVHEQDGTWTFHVTVEHPDTGWEDYADGWDVLTPAGDVLRPDHSTQFTRLLLHPHENEQPFTRSQSQIVIPEDVTQVRVRAHDLMDGYGGREVVVDLMLSSGQDFEVQR